jgi:Dicarboxylate transport
MLRRVLLGLLLGLVLLYAAAPRLAAWGLPRLLTRWGVTESHFEFGYPGWRGVDIEHFALHGATFDVNGDGVRVAYRVAALLRGEVAAVTLTHLTVLLGGSFAGAESTGRPAELPAVWSLIPARRVVVDELELASIDPPARAHGSVSFDPALLQIRLDVTSPLLAVPLAIAGTLDPNARLTLSAAQAGAGKPLVSLTGVPDAVQQRFAIDGNADFGGEALALLAAYAGIENVAGDAHVQLRGRLPWPLPAVLRWQDIDGSADVAVDLHGRPHGDADASLRLDAAVTLQDARLNARLAVGSELRLQVPQLAGSALAGDGSPELSLRADSAVDVDYDDGGIHIGDGLVLSAARLIAPLSLRPRGAWNADGTFELAVTSLEGSPRLLVAGKHATNADGTGEVSAHGQLVLAGRLLALLGRTLDVSDTSGQAVIDFDGRLPWSGTGLSLANALGKGRVDADVVARSAAGPRIAATMQADFRLADAALAASVESGARLLVTDAGVDATTFAAMPVDVQLSDGSISLGKTDVKLSLPAFELGQHSVQLANAWLTVSGATRHGDALAATALLRANTGREALPLRLSAQHDLGSGRGRYTLAADWRIKKPLLATQLALALPYDLDEGKLEVDLHGDWNLAGRSASLHGDGRIHFEGSAHDDTYLATGVVAELPLTIEQGGYAVSNATIDIGALDVGFPLNHTSLRLDIADDVAHIDGLRGQVLGGTFSASAFDYLISTDQAMLSVALDGLDLARVLALEGEDVKGSGTLDGLLPVRIDGDDLIVSDGHVAARAPGGTISYKSSVGQATAKTGLEFVFRALEDFHYDVLHADVALTAEGDMRLGVKLHGRNPAVENGRAIQFNLNLNESLPALLQSLRAAQGITERIEGKLSR